jgi:hypothetical protein
LHSFTTSALDGGEWSVSRLGRALPPGKGPPVPIAQEAGWAPEPVWTQRIEEKSFASAGDGTSIARSSSPQSDTIPTELPRLLFGPISLKYRMIYFKTVLCNKIFYSGMV